MCESRFSSLKFLIARTSDNQEFSISTNSAVFLISFVFREVGFVTTVTETILSDVLKVVYCGMEMRVRDPRCLCQTNQ